MSPTNTRDTLLRRSTTFAWGTGLMLAAGIVGFLVWPLFSGGKEIDDQYQELDGISGQLQEVHKDQAKAKAAYNYDRNAAAKKLAEQAK